MHWVALQLRGESVYVGLRGDLVTTWISGGPKWCCDYQFVRHPSVYAKHGDRVIRSGVPPVETYRMKRGVNGSGNCCAGHRRSNAIYCPIS